MWPRSRKAELLQTNRVRMIWIVIIWKDANINCIKLKYNHKNIIIWKYMWFYDKLYDKICIKCEYNFCKNNYIIILNKQTARIVCGKWKKEDNMGTSKELMPKIDRTDIFERNKREPKMGKGFCLLPMLPHGLALHWYRLITSRL